ncbi:MAG: beta-N-acetylhexosaminidase [Deltaproteobacteria bacterium]|nr:MAG: beta-N-acetylhexosaminidase [Deltaproteobacteria bacterium]
MKGKPMMQQNDPKEPAFWGQLLMVGLPGPRMDAQARELVRDLKVGGVILFARNIEAPEQVWELCRDLQKEAMAASGVPLLISVDQEGGPVQRLKAPFIIIPQARDLGISATPEEVEDLSRRVARELALVGINMNLAPVLDVPRSPACPLWRRAYSSDPERAARYALAAIRGYAAGGVFPVAKHFPGLGDTMADSHEVLPRALSEDAKREADLLPFRLAAAAGVPAVMTAHLLVPKWDDRPATLSAAALQDWLRRRLKFQGVIITDDLEMGAIASQLPVDRAGREALGAGADLLLICNNYDAVWDTARRLAGDASLLPRAQEAAVRIRSLRERIHLPSHGLQEVTKYFRQAAE